MKEDSAHARNRNFSAAAEIFANGTYFPNMLRSQKLVAFKQNPFFILIMPF
jgi:hypothetical protein